VCCWVSGSSCFKGMQCFLLQGSNSQRSFFLNCLIPADKDIIFCQNVREHSSSHAVSYFREHSSSHTVSYFREHSSSHTVSYFREHSSSHTVSYFREHSSSHTVSYFRRPILIHIAIKTSKLTTRSLFTFYTVWPTPTIFRDSKVKSLNVHCKILFLQ